MKDFKTILAAAALTLAVTGISMADPAPIPLDSGDGATEQVTASGTIDKYLTFLGTNVDEIDMGDFGGPNSTNTESEDTPSVLEFDANTHVGVVIDTGPDFTSVASIPGQIDAAGEDTLPTRFRIEFKGLDAMSDFTFNTSNSNTTWTNDGLYGSDTDDAASLFFGHGAGSGVLLGAEVDRDGLNDHWGTYRTHLDLTWSDWS